MNGKQIRKDTTESERDALDTGTQLRAVHLEAEWVFLMVAARQSE